MLRRLLAGYIVVVTMSSALASVMAIVDPSPRAPRRAGAVVVFSGDFGERADRGFELARRGIAPTVVLSTGHRGRSTRHQYCDQQMPFEVLCVRPLPATTRGEARMFADLATQRGWTSLLVVSSKEHIARAEASLDSCFSGRVSSVFVPRPRDPLTAAVVIHEWLGLLDVSVLRRWC